MSGTPGSSSQGPSVPKVKSKFDGKKHGERRVVGEARGPVSPGADPPSEPPRQESLHVLPSYGTIRIRPRSEGDGNTNEVSGARTLAARKSEKREASEEPQTEYPHTYEKYQKISGEDDAPDMGLMEALEEAEAKTIHLTSLEYCLPLIVCEEPVDISYLGSDYARDLSDATCCTRVGEVRQALGRCVDECLMAELCEDEEAESSDSIGASIFDHESPIGLELDESADRWTRDEASATWTRLIVIPRKSFCHPIEGEGGPDISTLSGKRSTLPSSGKTVRDN